MHFASAYLEKHQQIKFEIAKAPSGLLCYIVIIPAYREPDIISTLKSVKNANAITGNIEVYILFNYPEDDTEESKEITTGQYYKTDEWCRINSTEKINFTALLSADLPKKFAGVGLARKILMDLAVQRFNSNNKSDGIILSLDADTIVPENYFTEINHRNSNSPDCGCFVFNFEHEVAGTNYQPDVHLAAALYELHLRYYKQILQSVKFPYYHYTIGSSFAVRASVYVKAGGMNKRKAGEDFYFLQKAFMYGKTEFVPNLILKPSSRVSDRVPFGTGAAIRKIVGSNQSDYATYHPKLFGILKHFFELIPGFYNSDITQIESCINSLPLVLSRFLVSNNYLENILEAKQNTSGSLSFVKRFYTWFDAFKVIKFLNFARESEAFQIGIVDAVNLYLGKDNKRTVFELLQLLRERDMKEE